MCNLQPSNSFFRRHDLILLSAAGLLTGLFYALCLAPDTEDSKARHGGDRYLAWQAEAWLAGRLDLGRPIPPGLLALPDPYDPKANEPFRMQKGGAEGLHDLSFYAGKLYTYWAPAPVLVAYLPWRILTGTHLPTSRAAWLFAVGAWLASAVLLVRVARNHFPATPPGVLLTGLVSLAVCSWAPIVLQRASVWETPIFAACCFGSIAWWLLAECGWAARPERWRWLAAASLAWGLAVGSRPIWIVGAGVLAVPLWLDRARWRERDFRKLLLAAAVPLGVCVLALLLHNFLRFGRPGEFGQTWQLAGIRVQDVRLFSVTYAGFNLIEYLFAVPRAVAYYPFLVPVMPAGLPPGHLGTELTVGLFIVLPWLWLVVMAPRRASTAHAVLPVAISALSLLGVLIGFAGATARYQLEIAAPFAMLSAFGLLSWDASGMLRAWVRRSLCVGALFFTAAATIAVSQNVPISMRSEIAAPSWFQRASYRIATGIGWTPHWGAVAVELVVIFPAQSSIGKNSAQILVMTGRVPQQDTGVCVNYPDANHVRFSFLNAQTVTPINPTPVDRRVPHLLRVELGGMLPPATHPFWKDTPTAEITRRRTLFKIICDGTEVSSGVATPDYLPLDIQPEIGAAPAGSEERYVFTGEILSKRIVRSATP